MKPDGATVGDVHRLFLALCSNRSVYSFSTHSNDFLTPFTKCTIPVQYLLLGLLHIPKGEHLLVGLHTSKRTECYA